MHGPERVQGRNPAKYWGLQVSLHRSGLHWSLCFLQVLYLSVTWSKAYWSQSFVWIFMDFWLALLQNLFWFLLLGDLHGWNEIKWRRFAHWRSQKVGVGQKERAVLAVNICSLKYKEGVAMFSLIDFHGSFGGGAFPEKFPLWFWKNVSLAVTSSLRVFQQHTEYVRVGPDSGKNQGVTTGCKTVFLWGRGAWLKVERTAAERKKISPRQIWQTSVWTSYSGFSWEWRATYLKGQTWNKLWKKWYKLQIINL